MVIHNKHNQPFHLAPGIPTGYDEPVVCGTNMLYVTDTNTRVIVQQFSGEQYHFYYSRFCFTTHEYFTIDIQKNGLHLLVAMENHPFITLDNATIKMDQHQALLFMNEHTPTFICKPGTVYRIFSAWLSPALAAQLNNLFVQESKNRCSLQQLCSHPKPFYLTPATRDILRQILENSFDSATCRLYFDIKIQELFLLIMQHHYRRSINGLAFTDYELNRIAEARKLLLKDLSKKSYTIAQLSRITGINTFKLKIGFRQLYGMGVFECLQEQRMEYARDLLMNTGKPIKEICALSGYPRMTNFITAFRKKFGYTPGALRRK